MASEWDELIVEGLESYSTEVKQGMEALIKKLMSKYRKQLKTTAPRSSRAGKHYADSWKVTIEKHFGGMTAIIHNAGKPSLTHLLEHGHLTSDGTRTKPIEHIAPVQEALNEEFEREVTKLLGGRK